MLNSHAMATSIQEIYASTVRRLPVRERLQLAALILEDLARAPEPLDVSDAWSEQDQQDLTAFSLAHAANFYSDEDVEIKILIA